MKKKVLSVLLATALFAGSAVAVNAEVWGNWDQSSKSGADEDITKLEFDAASYEVENGQDLNLKEKLTAYVGTKAIVQEPELEWNIVDNDLIFGLGDDDKAGVVYAYENSGSTTVTVAANDGKVKTSCKIVAVPLRKATGYKFSEGSYKIPAYNVDTDVKLVPSPAGSRFSAKEQIPDLQGYSIAIVATKDDKSSGYKKDEIIAIADNKLADDNVSPTGGTDGVEFTFKKSDMALVKTCASAQLVVLKNGHGLSARDPLTAAAQDTSFSVYDGDKDEKVIKRNIRASIVEGSAAERAGRTGTITLEVGKTVALNDYVKYGPSEANYGKDLDGDWTIDYYNEAADDNDFAVINGDGDKALGVAVGKVKAVNYFGGKIIEIPINVVAKGSVTKSEMELSASSGTLAVGGTTWIEFKNAPSDPENITWTVDNDVVTIVPATGAGIKVFAKKTGTAKVTATYGDQTFEFTVTVNAKDAVAPVPTPGDDTVNPPTGDSLFANLF